MPDFDGAAVITPGAIEDVVAERVRGVISTASD